MRNLLLILLFIIFSTNLYSQEEVDSEVDSIILLNDLVITGQGAEISKSRLSYKVTTIDEEKINSLPSDRIDVLLSSQLPNSQINLAGGQTGSTSIIRGRGVNSAFTNSTPVIYVDGIRLDNLNTHAALGGGSAQSAGISSLADIPTENIERIEYINGGAATTLYGSDAANGVIQIITKKKARETSYILKSEIGLETPTTEFLFFDRTKDLLLENSLYQKYNLSISGGSKKVGYNISAGVMNSGGTQIYDNNEQTKYHFNSGLHANLNENLVYENSFYYSNNNFSRNRNGNQGGFTALWFAESGASVIIGPGFNNKLDSLTDEEFEEMKKFVNDAERLQNNDIKVHRFSTSQSLKLDLLHNLKLKLLGGLDYRTQVDKNVITNEYLSATTNNEVSNQGSINNYQRDYLGYTIEVNGQHKYKFTNFSIISILGAQLFSSEDKQIQYKGFNLPDGSLNIHNAAVKTSDDYFSEILNAGFYIQENLGFKNKLFLELGLRADYNEAFGDDIGIQFYPKFGLNYNMNNLSFKNDYINLKKIRANYGVSGNLPPAFSDQRTISFAGFEGNQAAFFGQPGNEFLKPEKTATIEAGLDFSILDEIIDLSIGYYNSQTRDALFYVPNVPSSGISNDQLYNVGEIENSGWEILANFTPIKTLNTQLDFSISYNSLHNEVVDTGGAPPFNINGFSSRTIQMVVEEGYPIGYLRASKGIFENGVLVDSEPLSFLGSTLPKNYGSINLNFRHKELSLFATANYQTGAYANNWDAQFRYLYGADLGPVPAEEYEAHGNSNWLNMTDLFIEKTDFLKFRHIGVKYEFNSNLIKSLRNCELGFVVLNPINIASSSFDPENTLSGSAKGQNSATTGGISYATYSNPRSYILSLKLKL